MQLVDAAVLTHGVFQDPIDLLDCGARNIGSIRDDWTSTSGASPSDPFDWAAAFTDGTDNPNAVRRQCHTHAALRSHRGNIDVPAGPTLPMVSSTLSHAHRFSHPPGVGNYLHRHGPDVMGEFLKQDFVEAMYLVRGPGSVSLTDPKNMVSPTTPSRRVLPYTIHSTACIGSSIRPRQAIGTSRFTPGTTTGGATCWPEPSTCPNSPSGIGSPDPGAAIADVCGGPEFEPALTTALRQRLPLRQHDLIRGSAVDERLLITVVCV